MKTLTILGALIAGTATLGSTASVEAHDTRSRRSLFNRRVAPVQGYHRAHRHRDHHRGRFDNRDRFQRRNHWQRFNSPHRNWRQRDGFFFGNNRFFFGIRR